MASVSWRGSNSNAPYVTLYLTQVSQNVNDNTSRLLYELILYRPLSISSGASKSYSINVNGSKVASGTTTIGGSGRKEIKSGYVTVSHNSDGTKSVSFSFSMQIDITFSGSWIGTVSASGSTSLTTIPRKSSLSVGNGTLNSSQTISISRASSSFTHTITYKCGSYSGTIANKTSSTSVSWTPSLTLANANTTGTSVSATITLTTYNGSTSLGSVSKNITYNIPSSVKPSINSVTVGSNPAEHLSTYGGYIRNRTKATFSISASTSYGSAIASYKVVVNAGTYSSSSSSITSNNLTSNGNLTATITVTDKRGRTDSTTRTLTVLDYNSPIINMAKVERCDQDGTLNSRGDYCKLSYKINVTALNNANSKSYSYRYKISTDATYTEIALSNNYYSEENFAIFPASISNGYNIELVATDDFATTKKILTLSAGSAIMNWLANKLGMAVGKIAELSDYFDVGYKAIFRKDLYMDNYSNNEKCFFFSNSANREGKTFSNDGVYPHDCKIYGGNGSSIVGIGMYDNANLKRIIAYNDRDKHMLTEVPLYFNDQTYFEYHNLPNSSAFSLASGFYIHGGFIVKWGAVVQLYLYLSRSSNTDAGNIANLQVGTVANKYRPIWSGVLSSGNSGPSVAGQVNDDGKVYLAWTSTAISASTSETMFTLSGTYIADFT